MRKGEAKVAFEQMFDNWEKELGITITAEHDPSFSDFCSWVERNRFSHYFNFRSVMGARDDARTGSLTASSSGGLTSITFLDPALGT